MAVENVAAKVFALAWRAHAIRWSPHPCDVRQVNDSMEHQEQLLRVMRVFAQFGDQASDVSHQCPAAAFPQSFDGCAQNILVPDRRVVMELLPSDVTMYYFSGEEVTVALFLFSDSLVIGTPKEGA